MPPIELLLPFLVATGIFAFVPGPGMFYMSIQTMARGQRAGWLSAAGFHVASYAHILAAAFGVTVLLKTQPTLFVALKFAGAAYLIWMGVKMLVDGRTGAAPPVSGPHKTNRQAFADSVAVELLNPKTALFYFTFLPQFTSLEAGWPVWAQISLLGLIANSAFTLTDAVCISFSQRLARLATTSGKVTRIGGRIGGTMFIAMGLQIAVRND